MELENRMENRIESQKNKERRKEMSKVTRSLVRSADWLLTDESPSFVPSPVPLFALQTFSIASLDGPTWLTKDKGMMKATLSGKKDPGGRERIGIMGRVRANRMDTLHYLFPTNRYTTEEEVLKPNSIMKKI